jgi:hypothetical protein
VMVPNTVKGNIKARLYVKDGNENKRHYGPTVELIPGQWESLIYEIPSMKGVCLEEAGVEFIPLEGSHATFLSYLDDFNFSGKPDYAVDFTKERMEVWHGLHQEVSQFTYLRGIWALEDGELSGSYHGEPAECYTGDLKWNDYSFEAVIIPKLGDSHNIQFRVQGGIRSYAVGLAPNNQITLYKNENGYKELKSTNYLWKHENVYTIYAEAVGNRFLVSVNGEKVIDFIDEENPYVNGQIGFSNFNGSHTHYKSFTVKGI